MKQLFLISICFLFFTTACKKIDDGVEDIGAFAEQKSGFEGIVTYAKDGKPAIGYPVGIQIGNINGTVSFNPTTGTFTPVPEPNSYSKTQLTDEKGKFSLTELNKNLPIRYGFLSALGFTSNGEFDYYIQQFIIEGVPQQNIQNSNELVLGKVKKTDIILHEAYKLELILNANKVDFDDEVKITGQWFSPVDGKAFEINSQLQIPKPTPNSLPFIAVFLGIKSKPNVPITLKIETFRNKVLKDTRTLVVKMDVKNNKIEVL